tara:strand:+ start:1368 stop:2504 length:1137 start_codon:yes stop_codon:yes gene_type:complete
VIWNTAKLGDACFVRRGTTITKKNAVEGDVPVIGGGTKPTYFHNEPNREAGCITISGSGASAGFVNRWDVPIFASDCSTVEPKDEMQLPKFVYYYLLSQQQFIYNNFRSGAAQPHVYAKDIETLDFPILPLAEQERIVAKLDAAFTEIDGAVELGQERLSRAAIALGQIVDNELIELREEHESCSLGEMLESVEYGTSTKCSKTGKYPVLRMGNMQTGSFVMDDLVYLDSDKELEKYRVRKGDVFFNRTNSALHVGKAAIYDGGSDCLFAGYLIRLNYSDDVLDGRFLNYYLNAPSTRAYGYSVMTSSVNQSNINGTKLKEYPFIKVDLKTQHCIRKKLDDITALLYQVNFLLGKSLSEYAQLKLAILAQELQPSEAA